MSDLHLGLVAPNYGPGLDPTTLVSAVQAAEAANYDSAWVTDHVAVPSELVPVYGEITEALVSLAFLATGTTRIKLGVSALVIPQRPALLTLKQVMSIDYLSQGRLMLCVAAGWTEREFENLGFAMRGRGKRLDTWLDLAQAAFASAPGMLTFREGGLDIKDAWLAPGGANIKCPTIWVGGHSPSALRRAARYGVWHPVGRPLEEVRRLAADFKRIRPDGQVVARVGVQFASEPARDGRDERNRPAIVGPTEWIVDQLLAYVAGGCNGFVLYLQNDLPGLSERIARFSDEVWPLVLSLSKGEEPAM